ncbi:MAG: phage tail sheath family protein [Myxococcota bacterium]
MTGFHPGISIDHVRATPVSDAELRGDILAVVGVVLEERWPPGATVGDLVQLWVLDVDAFRDHPDRSRLDPITRGAVASAFSNGSRDVLVMGVCVRAPQDICQDDRVRAGLLDALDDAETVALVTVPILGYLASHSVELVLPLIRDLMVQAARMPLRMVLLDAPRDAGEMEVLAFAERIRGMKDTDSSYGAIYWPWVEVGDRVMPPSPAVAGLFSRVEHEHQPHGIHWPPANQPLRTVTAPQVELTWNEGARLLEDGINPILVQRGRGVVVWGARTLSLDPTYRFINARRIVSYTIELLRRDAEWVVFEHQRPELWGTVGRMVRARLDELWGAGLLTGERAGNEYLVRCDEELNPPAVRDAGEIRVRVKLRPISTMEFVEVELAMGT